MLVLSRRAGESIRISDDIVISVQRVAGNRIVLGIEAPKEVSIRRGELAIEGAETDAAPRNAVEPAPAHVGRRGAANSASRAAATRPTRKRAAGAAAEQGRGLGSAVVGGPLAAWSTANLS